MQVKQVMTKNPEFLSPNTTLKNAAKEMQKLNCGFIPIGDNDRLVGTLTDRDIAIRAVAEGMNFDSTAVKDIMTPKVLYCFEDDDIEKAIKSMEKQQINRLVVLNKDKRMTGIISLGDIAAKCHDHKLCGHALESITQRTH